MAEHEFTNEQLALAEEIQKERYFTINSSGKTDTFVRAWVTLRTNAEMGVNFFSRKSRAKELMKSMEELKIPASEIASDSDKEVYIAEWESFAEKYIDLCYTDKAFGSNLFGLMHAKKTEVTERIRSEIILVTDKFPALFGEQERFATLKNIMLLTLEGMREKYEAADK